jgi:uncharacterized membrane protein
MANKQNLLAIAVAFVAGAAAYSSLPDSHIYQFERAAAAFLLPVATTITYGLLQLVKRKDPLREAGSRAAITVDIIVSVAVHFMVGLHLVVLIGLLTLSTAVETLVILLIGSTVIVVGNLLPRTRPNLLVGIRTENTLTNRAQWIRTHRIAGYVTVGAGLLILMSLIVT